MTLRRRGYLVEGVNDGTYVDVKELPDVLRKALKKVGYRRGDVRVVPTRATSVRSTAGKGSRGYAIAVNMSTGKISEIARGSWGGQNPFEREAVDWDDKPVSIPTNGAIITGEEGHKGTFATIYVNPAILISMLPGETSVSEREADVLRMASYKSFYKKELFERHRVTQVEIDALVKRGYMKRNKAGATSLTPKGKNAMSKKYF